MRIRKIMAVTMAACLVAGSLAGCGKKTEEKVIKIGVFEPTTGENGGGGFQEVLGIRYAREPDRYSQTPRSRPLAAPVPTHR